MWLSNRFALFHRPSRKTSTKSDKGALTLPRHRAAKRDVTSMLPLPSSMTTSKPSTTASTTLTAAAAAAMAATAASTAASSPAPMPTSATGINLNAPRADDAQIDILVVGHRLVPKSAVIRLGFEHLRLVSSKYPAGETYRSSMSLNETAYQLDSLKMDDTDCLDVTTNPPEIKKEYRHVQGGIVCYSVNDRDSMDCLPDLLNAFVTHKIPVFLVGLISDVRGSAKADHQLGQKLATIFGLPLILVDIYTPQGASQMQMVYTALTEKYLLPRRRQSMSLLYQKKQQMHKQYQQKQNKSSLPRSNPCYHDLRALSNFGGDLPPSPPMSPHEHPPKSATNDRRLPSPSPAPLPPAAHVPHDLLTPRASTESRRLSIVTTSSQCSSPDLTLDNMIKKLISWDYHDQGQNIQIFLTFFRKFITPSTLLQALIARYEQDLLDDASSARQQNGDASIDQPTRCQERIRTILSLWLSQHWNDVYYGPTYDTLTRFLQRLSHLPLHMAAHQLLLPLISRPMPMEDPDAIWALTDEDEPSMISHHSVTDSLLSMYLLTPTNVPSDTSLLTMNKDNHGAVVHAISTEPRAPASSPATRPPALLVEDASLFAGGLQLLNGKLSYAVNALHHSLKHTVHLHYAMLMDFSADDLADQLTWVELQLFRNLQPRDFIRHLWGEKGASEAILMSTSHSRYLTQWVKTMVLTPTLPSQRQVVLEKLICVAQLLYQDHRNYNALAAMIKGFLTVIPLFDNLDASYRQQLDGLVQIFRSTGNYESYRKDRKSAKENFPYLWLHRQDLVALAETKRDVTPSGAIHWEKFKTMGEIVFDTLTAFTSNSTIQPHPTILALLSGTQVLSEMEYQQRVLAIKTMTEEQK
ncbi:ras guanine nucleotide exchange factor domain-containing protein [Gongronella butleri]|nr:ras guanine nucleotide exchange factor domain-containing protein [Gongronella butleri]